MKVTVCFGSVRVVVPCGDGNLLVSELIDKAIVRYKKATGKSPDHWVAVHNLKAADGGILDNDDQLVDVADDREQIIALYDEQGGPPLHHNGGDGTSASSVGTSSPDIFHGPDLGDSKQSFRPFVRDSGKNDVVITQNDFPAGSSLIVRRGSEPVLTNIGNSSTDKKPEVFPVSPNKRWSAIANLDDVKVPRDSNDDPRHHRPSSTTNTTPGGGSYAPPYPQHPRSEGTGQERQGEAREGEPDDVNAEAGSINSIARDSTRRSLANNQAMWKWLEAQENQQRRGTDRKEPLGGSGDPEDKENRENFYIDINAVTVVLKNTHGPLGIHVVPDYREDGSDTGGLVIQGIEPRGRIYQDGRLKVLDKIVEINGASLKNVQFAKAQELFKQSLETPELKLKVLKSERPPPLPKQPPPLTLPIRTVSGSSTDNQDGGPSEGEALSPPVSPSKKTPPPLPVRAPTTALTSRGSQGKGKIIAPTNTKRIGRKMLIVLKKGSQGLGFSVTTRDNPAGGVPPIYIKNILPKGAAIEDGRLMSGDRLLEVNGEDVSGKSQSDVVAMLRTTMLGSTVSLVVSRIVQEEDKFTVPRELSDSQTSSSSPPVKSLSRRNSQSPSSSASATATPSSPSHDALQPQEKSPDNEEAEDSGSASAHSQEKEVLALDIPLSDSGSAGLGVSVKGRTAASAGQKVQDMGIFIKAVISGGAASKDGRLMVNDQLIKVNGENLSGKSNTFAMETLRKAMQKEGPISGRIHLVIARRQGLVGSDVTDSPASREVRISQSDQSDGYQSVVSQKNSFSGGDGGAMVTDANANKQNYMDLNDGGNNKSSSSSAISRLASSSLVIGRSVGEGVASADSGAVGRLIGESSFIGRSLAIGGVDNSAKLRNTSYQIATTDETLNQTASEKEVSESIRLRNRVDSPHGRQTGGATISTKPRPASSIGFQHQESSHEDPTTAATKVSKSNENLLDRDAKAAWLEKWEKNPEIGQEESGLSPTEDPGFSREGFGRQSMSEKRKGYLDPRMSEFYQKVKDLRDKRSDQYASGPIARVGSAESLLGSHLYNLHDPTYMHESMYPYARVAYLGHPRLTSMSDRYPFTSVHTPVCPYLSPPPYVNPFTGKSSVHQQLGPTLGLKKSSSLESLQTAVQEVALEEEAKKDGIVYRSGGQRGMVRGRGCNESFRAAVDRSYEQQEPMETLPVSVEEEGESETGSSLCQQDTSLGRNNSHASSVAMAAQGELDVSLSSGGDEKKKRKNSKKEKKEKKDKKEENKGIFSGLFKFGKSRKASDPGDERPVFHKNSPSERNGQPDRLAGTRPEQDRIQEQQRMLQEKQRQQEVAKQRDEEHRLHQQQQQQQQHSYREAAPSGASTAAHSDKIQALRLLHQQKHRERQGVYPLEDKEEIIERHLRHFEKKKSSDEFPGSPDRQGSHAMLPPPPRRQPTPERPERSRSVQDSDSYSHYANIEEIRQQLRRHDYLQQQQRYQVALSRQQPPQQHQQALSTTMGGVGASSSRVLPPTPTGGSMGAQLPPPGPHHHHHHHPNSLASRSQTYLPHSGAAAPAAASHYADPRQLRASQQAHQHQLYSRSYGPDSKGEWGGGGYQGSSRSLTPAPPPGSSSSSNNTAAISMRTASPSPTRPRAQTPTVVGGYSSPTTAKVGGGGAGFNLPHSRTVYQAPPPHSHPNDRAAFAGEDSAIYHHQQQRHHNNNYSSAEYTQAQQHAYTRERVEGTYQPHEPHFGSLPRRRGDQQHHNHPHGNRGQGLGLMSSSAQV